MNLTIEIEKSDRKLALFGPADRNLRTLREALGVTIAARGEEIKISGNKAAVARAAQVFDQLQRKLRRQEWLSDEELSEAISSSDMVSRPSSSGDRGVDVFSRGFAITPKTEGQREYLDTILRNDLTICTGPAGTGKTYLAVAAAVSMLKRGQVKRLVLARPAVEAGEKLGFLPGDLQQKVNPYLRPLFDALHDMMDYQQVNRFMSTDVIEVVPLAFMRGRTLNESVIILDEAQNTTVAQMLMFLTRLGQGSKMIVTGDASQVDLPKGTASGLDDAIHRLHHIDQIGIVELQETDIVRHKLVTRIVHAYGQTPHK